MLGREQDDRNDLMNDSSSQSTGCSVNNEPNQSGLHKVPSFDPANEVALSWHNINVFVRPKKKRFYSRKDENRVDKQVQLLEDVNGEVKPGHVLAIMGASGAGKTTLLNVLTNRNSDQLVINGTVLVNGKNVGALITNISAYVQQDDMFIGTLTVKEHLIFQALLRMDRGLSYTHRMRKVDQVILELGLAKCSNTIIGVAGKTKGISGGEAKRLALAAEVLTNPALMFVDEPTTGLDSFMSENIVSVLRNLAEGGRTIIFTIHQPSSKIYEMFDNILLMAEGRVAYMGKSSKALSFFESVGLHCPVNYNPADFFIYKLAVIPRREVECRERISMICTEFNKLWLRKQLRRISHSLPGSSVTQITRYKASWCTQFRIVLWRSWIVSLREPKLTKVRLIQATVVATVLGFIYLQQKHDQKGIMNLNGAMFILLVNISSQNIFTILNTLIPEKIIFLREHLNGMYRTDVYFLSKTTAELPIIIMTTTIASSILYWMIGLNRDCKAFLVYLLITILIANTAASYGYMIAVISSSLNVALAVTTPLLLPLMLFGGFFINNASVPKYFLWVKYISWFYYGNEVLIINQWSQVKNITCDFGGCIHNGKEVLDRLSFKEENFFRNFFCILALLLFFRILAYILLLYNSSRRS